MSNDLFLATSNLHGEIIISLVIIPWLFSFSTVLSVDPVSKTYIPSASFIESYHLSTNFSSFLQMAYTQTFLINIPSFF